MTRVKSWVTSNAEATVAYGTQAGYFGGPLGTPTVVCGPGSINQANRPDEFVSTGQLAACTDFLNKIAAFCRQ